MALLGCGVLAAHGDEGFDRALRAGTPLAPRVTEVPFERHVRGIDPRGFDRAGRMLTVAAALALRDAGVRLQGALRDRAGLFAAITHPSHDTQSEFWGSIRARGYPLLSAAAFTQIVVNAPAGAVSRALSLRGPVTVLAGGVGSTLAALALAAELLGTHADAELLAVGGVDDRGDDEEGEALAGEGAACVLVAREEGAPRAPVATLEGWGMAAPEALGDAVALALASAGLDAGAVDAVYHCAGAGEGTEAQALAGLRAALGARLARVPSCDPTRVFGRSDVGDALALAAAFEALRVGRAHDAEGSPVGCVLVASADELAGAFAVVLRRYVASNPGLSRDG